MAKRNQNGVLVINQAQSSVEVEFKVPELLKKISDEDKKTDFVRSSPRFNLNGVELCIIVCPDYKSSGFIGVALYNISDQDQMISATFKTSALVGSFCLDRKIIPAWHNYGYDNFLSHDEYKKWAQENGDVFKLEVSVSLRTRDKETVAFSSFGKTIMEDDSTADFIIRCKSKAFNVHKNFFCARLGQSHVISYV